MTGLEAIQELVRVATEALAGLTTGFIAQPSRRGDRYRRSLAYELRVALAGVDHTHCDWCKNTIEPASDAISSHDGEFHFCTEKHLYLFCYTGKCDHCEPAPRGALTEWLDVTEVKPE